MSGEKAERTLILCVDRDDDVGTKANARTPIIGKEENLRVATRLAISDPEEADANAMFEAVRLYEQLTASAGPGEAYEVATITGSPLGGVKADKKLLSELDQVLKAFPADGIILVSDGYADEDVIPLIQSRAPIVSVRRVVVRHSKSIEETAALFSRYVKLLMENPRYSRLVLGFPGVLVLALAILWALDLLRYAWMALSIGIGTFMLIKGFRLDYYLERLLKGVKSKVFRLVPPHVYLVVMSYVAGTVVVLLGIYQVVWYLKLYAPPAFAPLLNNPAGLVGWVFVNTSHIFIAGFCILILGRCIHWFMRKDERGWYGLVGLLVCAWFYKLLYEVGRILMNPMLSYADLMTSIVLGIIFTSIATVAVNIIKRRRARAAGLEGASSGQEG